MAVSQYIGARYVPLFYTNPDDQSNDWHSGVQYDPLTIVTDLNQSYTSKIPVPATIGRPSENPTYWILTGAYNAQVASLADQVDDLTDSVDNITTTVNGLSDNVEDLNRLTDFKIICIGDSYLAGGGTSGIVKDTNSWGAFLRIYTGTDSDTCVLMGQGSTGFVAGSPDYITQLRNSAQGLTEAERAEFTHIIVQGGLNDLTALNSGSKTIAQLETAVHDFVVEALSLYPNAKVYVGYYGWDTTSNANITKIWDVIGAYKLAVFNSSANNSYYITESEYVVATFPPSRFNDGVHPSGAGGSRIAMSIFNAVFGPGGSSAEDFLYKVYPITFTGEFGDTTAANCSASFISGMPDSSISGGELTIVTSGNHRYGNLQWVKIGTIDRNTPLRSVGGLIFETNAFFFTAPSTYEFHPVSLKIVGREIYVNLHHTTYVDSFNVNIYIPSMSINSIVAC